MFNIFKKKQPCKHTQNYDRVDYIVDNTPMTHFYCLDCGWEDRGHVYGDIEDWEESIQVRNGVRVEWNGLQ
jgi:hypothetical protein